MPANVQGFFDSSDFMPHGMCYLWRPDILLLNVVSDLLIGIAYFSIPLFLYLVARRRPDLLPRNIMVLFISFIFLCGLTHFFASWVIWNPDYAAHGMIKAVTALVSVMTAVVLWVNRRPILAIPSIAQVQQINTALTQEIDTRSGVEAQLRETESVLSRALGIARLGSWNWDIRTDRLWLSEQTARLFGQPRDFAPDTEGIRALFPAEDRPAVDAEIRRAVIDQVPVEVEHRIVSQNGEIRHAHTRVEPVIDDTTGRTVMLTGISEDVTDRKRMEAELQHAHKMEAVGQLTGGIAHDFNNLLAVVIGSLDLAKDHITPGSVADTLIRRSERAAERGAELTHRLLAFSRGQVLEPRITNVNELLDGMIELMRRTLGGSITIGTALDDALAQTMVDHAQFESAILNLALNARDAMPDGGRLTIATANADLDQAYADSHEEVAPGAYVMIAVTDDGEGMAPDAAARAFEPFFTTKDVGAGSGLGLSMVYGFVKQSGGHVAIESAPGEGTTVRIYLPQATAAKARQRPAGDTGARPGGDEAILVVEDDADVREFLVTALQSLGYTVHEAEDGPAALRALDALDGLDLLLTDMVMPHGMSGRDVAQAVAGRFPRVRVLFTSGYSADGPPTAEAIDGGAEMLAKPYTRDTLAQAVRRLLDTVPAD